MLRKEKDFSILPQINHKGGEGTIYVKNFLELEEMHGAARCAGLSIIPPGCSIGEHAHIGDFEIYYMLEGKAVVKDDGIEKPFEPGDLLWCDDGHTHAIRNVGDTDVKYITIIFYTFDK